MILLLAACAPTPWTPESALAPHLARLDTHGDGVVTAAEYARTRREGPPFATADHDGDGALDAGELAWLVRAQSPTTFDGDVAPMPAGVLAEAPTFVGTREGRHVRELLVWMGDAVRSTGRAGPNPAAVQAAVQSGRMDSPATVAVLAALRRDWEAAGWAWPVLGGR